MPQVEQLRASASYSAWLKKWNLPVYFSLRFQDIGAALESKLAAPSLQPAPPPAAAGGAAQPALQWAQSAAVWAGLQRCASPDIFLPQLADKFVRLALQLLARYAHWITAGMRQRSEAAAAAAATGGGEQHGGTPTQQQQQQQQGADRSGSGGSGSSGRWEAAATPEQLAGLRQDVDALLAALLSSFVPRLAELLGGMGQEVGEAVAGAFGEAAEELDGAGAALMGAVADSLVDKSVVVLKQVNGSWRVCMTGTVLGVNGHCGNLTEAGVTASTVQCGELAPSVLTHCLSACKPHRCTLLSSLAAARHCGHVPHDGTRAAHPPLALRVHDPGAAAPVPPGVQLI